MHSYNNFPFIGYVLYQNTYLVSKRKNIRRLAVGNQRRSVHPRPLGSQNEFYGSCQVAVSGKTWNHGEKFQTENKSKLVCCIA